MPKKQQDYRHKEKALMRPEAGAQKTFHAKEPPATYRYDSSLSPELQWDENAARAEGDDLLRQIAEAADLEQAKQAADRLRRMGEPYLNWSGKAERGSIEVPTLPLFVHERLSVQAVIDTLEQHKRNRAGVLDLYGEGDKNITEKIGGAYQHKNGWQNRLILGDSLQVMNSLLQYENMGGQVQMVYMDPPYGIKFGSNFQPFVRSKKEVKDSNDDSFTREPEMVQAYRDTWELGTHSWLTYMRDRLLLAREMLANSGCCFVQISDENVHLVRNVMDEVFGAENFVSIISLKKGGTATTKTLPNITDFILMYAKDKHVLKYRQLFTEKKVGIGDSTGERYDQLESPDGKIRRPQTREERKNPNLIPEGWKPYKLSNPCSIGDNPQHRQTPLVFDGEDYYPPANRHWSTTIDGMKRLIKQGRIVSTGKNLAYVLYLQDFPLVPLNNFWEDSLMRTEKLYVVQTAESVIEKCILMATDPGDLVFDLTCGSGTTANVAEQWGRRWITTDVSRVPLSLARQRLLTAVYPYYKLKSDSPSGGFSYVRKRNKKDEEVGGIVPHITLKSNAHDEPPAEERLADKPEVDNKTVRVSGPFCVEAIMPPPLSPQQMDDTGADEVTPEQNEAEGYIARMTEILRLSPNIRLPKNQILALKNVRQMGKSLNLHAEAIVDENAPVAVVFGPANAAIGERVILEAAHEAGMKKYTQLLVIAFAIEPPAREAIEKCKEMFDIEKAFYAQATTDLAMADLLKNMRSSEIFAVCGMPEIESVPAPKKENERKILPTGKKKDGEPLYQIKLKGLDVYDPVKGDVTSSEGNNVPCWMLDTDYDGYCFRARQIFFPRTLAWDKIKKALQTEFSDSVWQHLGGDTSAPFVLGEQKQIAVKVIDDRGNELLVVKKVEE